jgi:trimethylamine--corrinoid protein Co-methyltransferase
MPMPMAGISSPSTIAGVVTVAGAEALAMNVIAQLANPNTPVVFTPRTGYLDMSAGVYAVGLEYGIISAAQVQMAREKYGMPVDVFGPHTNSVLNDNQAMIESVFGSIFAAFAGASVIGGAGSIEGGITVDPAQMVIAEEILKMEFKAVRGFEVDDDTIGLDAIKEVGIGHDFLSIDHTLDHFRTEFYRCPLFDLRDRNVWKEQGAKDMNQRAREKAMAIMNEHRPKPLDKSIVMQMTSVVERAERETR